MEGNRHKLNNRKIYKMSKMIRAMNTDIWLRRFSNLG